MKTVRARVAARVARRSSARDARRTSRSTRARARDRRVDARARRVPRQSAPRGDGRPRACARRRARRASRAAPSRGETRAAVARRRSSARRRAIDARASAPTILDAVARFVASVDDAPRDVAASALTTIGAFVWVKAFDALADRGAFASTTSRKLVHVTSGTLFACTWPLFSASGAARFFAAAIPLAQGVRLFGIGSGMIKNASAVRAVSREGGKEELLKGPLYYTAVLAACTSAYWRTNPIGIVAMAMMCGGDGFADLVGRKFGKGNALPWNEEKSFAGSAGFVAGGFGVASGCVSIDGRESRISTLESRAISLAMRRGMCFRRARVRCDPRRLTSRRFVSSPTQIIGVFRRVWLHRSHADDVLCHAHHRFRVRARGIVTDHVHRRRQLFRRHHRHRVRFVVILDFIRDIDGVTARRARRETNMHSFHGTFIRNCIVTHVIDGKTIRVLLNPDGGQQRSSTGDGWEDSLVVGSEPTSRIPSDELDASSVDPTTWEKVDVRLIYVDTEESLEVKKEEQAYKPITPAGVEAFDWLKKRLGSAADGRCGDVEVDIEFDTCEFMTSVSRAREYSLDKYGRVLAYVYHNGNSVNVETVLAGQSAYFTKHGRSRLVPRRIRARGEAGDREHSRSVGPRGGVARIVRHARVQRGTTDDCCLGGASENCSSKTGVTGDISG